MLEIGICPAQVADAPDLSHLIRGLSHQFLATPDALLPEAFMQSISPDGIAACINDAQCSYWVATAKTGLIAAACLKGGFHLHHMFVAEPFQRLGVATRLWRQLLKMGSARHGQLEVYTVNASLVAVPVYERWGFLPVDEPVCRNGLCYQPMTLHGLMVS